MSRLDELIAELCPDGVEYKAIKSCVEKIANIKWSDHIGEHFRYIDLTSVNRDTHQIEDTLSINMDNAPSRAQQLVKENDVLLGATRPLLKRYCIVPADYDGDICSTGFCVLRAIDNIILPRYLYHIISSTEFISYVEKYQKGASYPAIADADTKNYRFPVPPLPVQQEIVRILDHFTELTAELQKQLDAELTARKKQYEHYLDKVIQSFVESPRCKLNEVCGVYDGTHQTPQYTETGVRFVSVENIDDLYGSTKYISEEAYNRYKVKPQKNDILMTRITAGIIGKCSIVDRDEPLAFYVSLALLKPDSKKLNARYLKFYLESRYGRRELRKYILTDATPPKINKEAIGKVSILLPPLEKQTGIVETLSNLDSLCNDLTSGLPAEIAARQKQYEYYRDKLLTFKELKKS